MKYYFFVLRLVRDIEDPSLVPEYWICSMNPVSIAVGNVINICNTRALVTPRRHLVLVGILNE